MEHLLGGGFARILLHACLVYGFRISRGGSILAFRVVIGRAFSLNFGGKYS